jgi:hypothetical protein
LAENTGSGHVWQAPCFLLAPRPRLILTPFPTGLAKVSALADWFPYLKPCPHMRLTHRPDDGGSKDLWNVGKLLPDYMALQPGRQPSLYSPLWEPQSLQVNKKFLLLMCISYKWIRL